MARTMQFNVQTTANTAGLTRMQAALQRMRLANIQAQRSLTLMSTHMGRFQDSAGRATSTIRRMGTALVFFGAAGAAARGFQALIKGSFEFNKTMEQSRISIAALIVSSSKMVDAQKRLLSPTQAFQTATAASSQQLNLLRNESLLTTASFEDLARAFEVAIAPGLQGGLQLNEIRMLTRRISQVATSLGMSQNQLPEEIRSILQGTIRPQTTRIATVLGISNEDVKRWKEAGTLGKELISRFEAFAQAEGPLAQTFAGLTNRLKGAFNFAAGTAGKGLFDQIKTDLHDVIGFLIQVKDTGVEVNEKVLAVMGLFFGAVSDVVTRARKEFESISFESAFTTMENFANAMRVVGLIIINVAAGIIKSVAHFGMLSKKAGEFLTGLGLAGKTISTIIKSVVELGALWFILNTVINTFMGLLNVSVRLVGNLASAMAKVLAMVNLTTLRFIVFGSILATVVKIFNDVTQDVLGTSFSMIDQLATMFMVLQEGAKVAASVLGASFKIGFALAKGAMSSFETGLLLVGKAGLWVADRVVRAFNVMKGVVLEGHRAFLIAKAAATNAEEDWTAVQKLEDTINQGFEDPEFASLLDKRLEDSAARTKQAGKDLADASKSAFDDVSRAVSIGVDNVWEGAGNILEKGGKGALIDSFKTTMQTLADAMAELNSSSGMSAQGTEDFATRVQAALDKVKTSVEEFKTAELQITPGRKRADKDANAPTSIYDALQKGFESFVGNYQSSLESIRDITTHFVSSLSSFISDSIVKAFDPTEKTSLRERFASFLQDISSMVIKEMIKWAIMQAALSMFPGFQSVPAQPVAQAAGIGRAGGGRIPRWRPQGLAAGGRPRGLPASDTVPIWATPGEFMMRVAAVQKYGAGAMEAINRGLVNPMALQGLTNVSSSSSKPASPQGGFATGGEVSSTVPVTGSGGVTQAVVVANDDAMDKLATGGKSALFKFMRDNRSTLKGILR